MSRYFIHNSDDPIETLHHVQSFLARAFRGSVPQTQAPSRSLLTRASNLTGGGTSGSGGGSGGGGGSGSVILFGDCQGPANNNTNVQATGPTGFLVTRPGAVAPATPAYLTITPGADTALAAGVEANDVLWSLNRTQQWATGALPTQRAVWIRKPTYSFAGPSTITNAITMEIEGAPIAGANATITNPMAMRIMTGSDAGIGLVIQGNSPTQSGDHIRIRTSLGHTLLDMNAAGEIGINSVPIANNRLYLLSTPTASGEHGMNVQVLNSDANNANTTAFYFQSFALHSTGILPSIYGAWGYAINLSTSTSIPATEVCNAILGISRQIGSGTLDFGMGLQASMVHDAGAGFVNHWVGVYSSTSIGAGVTAGDVTHFYAQDLAPGAGAFIPNRYAFYAAPQTVATTNYGVYILGASVLNYMQGNLGINQVTPTAGVHIVTADLNTVGMIIDGSASQAVPFIRVRDSALGVLLSVTQLGDVELRRASSTTEGRLVGGITGGFNSSTDASYTGRVTFSAADFAGTRECLRIEGDGTNPRLGALGAPAIARPAAYTLAGTATRTLPTITGQDNTRPGAVYAKAADLQALEGVVRQLLIDLASTSGFGFLAAA